MYFTWGCFLLGSTTTGPEARRNRLLQPFGFEDTYLAGIYTLRSVLEMWQLSSEKKEVSNEDMLSG